MEETLLITENIKPRESTGKPVDYSMYSDEILMELYAQGEFQAFEELYEKHKGGVYRYFLRHIPNQSLAEDLYQDIWSKVIAQRANYKVTAKFTTWLYTLAHNKLIDHIRHSSVVNKVFEKGVDSDSADCSEPLRNSSEEDETAKIFLNNREVEALKLCIGKLPLMQKDCFLLKEEAGLSVRDIALVLDTSFEACKSRLRYAYQNLRQCIIKRVGNAYE